MNNTVTIDDIRSSPERIFQSLFAFSRSFELSLKRDDRTELAKYKLKVEKDILQVFKRTIYPMSYIRSTYYATFMRIKKRTGKNHTIHEIHQKSIEITERFLNLESVYDQFIFENRNTEGFGRIFKNI